MNRLGVIFSNILYTFNNEMDTLSKNHESWKKKLCQKNDIDFRFQEN